MTVAEKLEVMKALWADLSRNPADVESPAWHEAVLKEREARLQAGLEVPVDWEEAKKHLRAKLL
ncbi:MAG: hypothetical protein RLZZ15_41 [Verrucomicrobiota bacterium]